MTTVSDILEAELLSRRQRRDGAKLLRIDETKDTPGDLALFARIQDAVKGDGHEYDRALADKAVNEMFRRGVVRFWRC